MANSRTTDADARTRTSDPRPGSSLSLISRTHSAPWGRRPQQLSYGKLHRWSCHAELVFHSSCGACCVAQTISAIDTFGVLSSSTLRKHGSLEHCIWNAPNRLRFRGRFRENGFRILKISRNPHTRQRHGVGFYMRLETRDWPQSTSILTSFSDNT